MTFTEFLNQYNGQQNVGNTTENRGECVGLVAVWVDALNLPHIWGNASDLFNNADEKYFEKILNTPDAIPQQGDIIVWSAKFNGTVGHTAIATGTADLNTLECFSQNDPLGSNCHLKTYNYNYIVGWLRPLSVQNQQAQIDELRKQRDDNWNLYQTELTKNNDLSKQLQDEQKKCQDLRDVLDKQTEADANTGAELLDVSHERDIYKDEIERVKELLNLTYDKQFKDIEVAIKNLEKPVEEQVKPLVQHTLTLQEVLDDFVYIRVPQSKSLLAKIERFIGRALGKFWEIYK